jgi:UDP-3-O-[3-hydroxymyristoyl] glucosamine N-acyltransferase
MENGVPTWTLGELAALLGAQLDGPAGHPVVRPVPADSDDALGIAFAESEKYLDAARASGCGAVILAPDAPSVGKPALRHPSPRAAFGALLALARRPVPLDAGVDPRAAVHPDAKVDPAARIGAFAVVERGAVVGPECRVYGLAYVGENCVLGAGCVVYPHAVLVQDVTLGEGCVVHPGAVLGADGFAYVWDGARRVKVPQAGSVLVGDAVEIGALAAVDRATCGETRVDEGAKLDNLVMIAHNCHIGPHTVMAAQVGIAGSSKVGARCVFGGQAAVPDHVTIGDDVTLAGRAAVGHDLTEPGVYFGVPAVPAMEGQRILLAQARLPELLRRVRRLEQELSRLQKQSAAPQSEGG